MSIARTITPHLPFLRRFARLLNGSQESGDRYVSSLLELLIEDPSSFPQDLDPRIAVYRIFVKLWNSVDVNLVPENASLAGENKIERKLGTITPLPRQTFLLSSVEGFSTGEVAQILEKPESEVKQLVDDASREIADQVSTDVLIIEDEPMIALDLEQIVVNLGHTVTDIARTHKEAVSAAGRKSPGLILADIRLADGSSGIDAVNEMIKTYDVPVIFITAYPERLLTGERPEPAFLITKPYRPESVKAIISQALFFEKNAGSTAA